MSSDELQSNGFGVNGNHDAAGSSDVTIKFFGSDLLIQAHKAALIAGSAFFSNHFLQHPSSTKITAPKAIRPGATISVAIVQAAIDYLHGATIPEKDIARNSIPLLLAAVAFGITSLEERIKKHLTQTLDRQFAHIAREIQIIDLVDALRDLYGCFKGEDDIEVGKEVAGIVTGAAAHACCCRFPVLKKSPEFMGLLREVPVLAYDILAADVEVVSVVGDGEGSVEGEDDGKMGEGADEVITEVVEEAVEVVVEEVVQPIEE